MQSPTQAELYNDILEQMRKEGKTDAEIILVAEYLTGRKVDRKYLSGNKKGQSE